MAPTRKKCAEDCTCGRHSPRITPEGRARMGEAARGFVTALNASRTPEERRRQAWVAGMARQGLATEGRTGPMTKAEQRKQGELRNAALVSEERAKRGSACERCGSTDGLEWHHRDRFETRFRIGNGMKRVSMKQMRAEIAKCDLLCKPCHSVVDALFVVSRAVASDPRWRSDLEKLLGHPAQ